MSETLHDLRMVDSGSVAMRIAAVMNSDGRLAIGDGQIETHVLPVVAAEDTMRWQERALCAQVDPEAFFPDKGATTRDAKRVCQSCPVRSECLEDALRHNEGFGIRGGLTERERRHLKRRIVQIPQQM